ncbi:rod outer segment membrane protein 1b [Mobula birostris]|uniref:rod outer segment membrane protein 1b n=1 Tax=Mobula birostris TaxID=1983395 RepID=UPI003B28841E
MALLGVRFTFQKRVQLAQTLWALSGFCALAGVATFGLGVYLKCELRRHGEVMDNADVHLVPHALIAAGALSALSNLAGAKLCRDSVDPERLPRWKSLAGPYLFLSSLLSCLLLASSLLSYLMRGSLDASLRAGLRDSIRFYKDTDTPGRCFRKRTVDLLQMEFRCCGNSGYRDWFEVQWVSNRYLDFSSKEVRDRVRSNVDGRYLIDGVPFSCCNPDSPRPCIQLHLANSSAHFSYDVNSEELNIWKRGCREALLNHYTSTMASIGTAVLLCYIVQLGVLIGLRYLSVSSLAAVGQPEPEADTEGYLLEKGPLETVRAAAKAVSSAFSSGQVQTEPAPAEEKVADK